MSRPLAGPGSQGYLLVAVGHQKYYDLAVAAAASLKLKDPGRPVALVHDGEIAPTPDWPAFFDHLRPMPTDGRYYVSVGASAANPETIVACGNLAPPAQ